MTEDEAGSLLDALSDEAADVLVAGDEYRRGSVTFAARPADDIVELRLGREIAEAATRTPDTGAAVRGPDWIRFAPREWDDHALDRLEAWFRVAWRLAARR